jgi:hypothetical protein
MSVHQKEQNHISGNKNRFAAGALHGGLSLQQIIIGYALLVKRLGKESDYRKLVFVYFRLNV